jgi:hypothetical protein
MFVIPAGQVHVPPAHVALWGQALPHIPQLFASVMRLVHIPLQLSGVGATHMPPLLLLVLVLVLLVVVLVLVLLVVVDVLVLLLEAVMPPMPELLELVVAPPMPPIPEPPIPEDELAIPVLLDAVEPAFTFPPAPDVEVLLFLVPPPQPTAAPCSATTDTASVSHDRRLISCPPPAP